MRALPPLRGGLGHPLVSRRSRLSKMVSDLFLFFTPRGWGASQRRKSGVKPVWCHGRKEMTLVSPLPPVAAAGTRSPPPLSQPLLAPSVRPLQRSTPLHFQPMALTHQRTRASLFHSLSDLPCRSECDLGGVTCARATLSKFWSLSLNGRELTLKQGDRFDRGPAMVKVDNKRKRKGTRRASPPSTDVR